MKLQAPIKIAIIVCITNDDGMTGEVTVGLGNGVCPTAEDIKKAIKQAEEAASSNGYRLMNKQEFVNQLISEKTGSEEHFAVPGGDEWEPMPAKEQP